MSEQDWLEWSLGTFLLLSVGISFSAVGTFRRERETGALELILVTPLRVRTIITGRLQGIWLQFAPAIGVLAVVTVMGAGRRTWAWDDAPFMAYVVSTYLTMPVLGMMASTLPGNWMAAWVATLLVGLLSPFAPEAAMWCGATLWNVVRMREFELNNEMARALSDFWNSTAALQAIRTHALPLLSQWVVALGAGVALHWRLRRRALGGR